MQPDQGSGFPVREHETERWREKEEKRERGRKEESCRFDEPRVTALSRAFLLTNHARAWPVLRSTHTHNINQHPSQPASQPRDPDSCPVPVCPIVSISFEREVENSDRRPPKLTRAVCPFCVYSAILSSFGTRGSIFFSTTRSLRPARRIDRTGLPAIFSFRSSALPQLIFPVLLCFSCDLLVLGDRAFHRILILPGIGRLPWTMEHY